MYEIISFIIVIILYITVIILYSFFRSMKKFNSKVVQKLKGPHFLEDKMAVKIAKVLDFMNFNYEMGAPQTKNITFEFNLLTNHIKTQCYIVIEQSDRYATLLMQNPVIIPEAKRMRIFEFIGMINYKYRLGHFKMNHETGESKFLCSETFEFISEESIENIAERFHNAFYLMDQIFPGLMAVGFGNVPPAEMFDRISGKVNARLN